MSLKVLEKYDRETAAHILAATALAVSPNPGFANTDFVATYADEQERVLHEIRQRLRIRENDISTESRVSIANFLGQALDDALLTSTSIDAALKQAGQAGRLSPAMYKVLQPGAFMHQFYPLGVRKKDVEQAVHAPDDYQHLMSGELSESDRDCFSLFLKQHLPHRNREGFWLLVQCYRQGIEQLVQSAWRVYPSDVDLRHAKEPVDVLRAFVSKFGEEISIAGKRGKFIEDEIVPNPSGETFTFGVEHHNLVPESFTTVSHRVVQQGRAFRLGIAYAINIGKYREALKAHQ